MDSVIIDCSNTTSSAGVDPSAPEGRIKASFAALHDYRGHSRRISASVGVVAADHGRCSDIGVDILQRGGNAVDASITVALCQGIYNPMASGLGGGHFSLIRFPNGSSEVIDAREVAAQAANETMYVRTPALSLAGGLAVGVPLELSGFHVAHARHGKLPWKDVIEPIISLAEGGFPAHPYLIATLDFLEAEKYPSLANIFLKKKGTTWRVPHVNETCCARPALAAFLKDVAEGGAEVLYSGKYTELLVRDVQEAGGIIASGDLHKAQAVVRQPLTIKAFGVDLIAAPPPSSAIAVLLAFKLLEQFDLPLAGAESLGRHRVIEAMKHAFALRMNLGDPGLPGQSPQFVEHLDRLIIDVCENEDYIHQLKELILNDSVLTSIGMYGGAWNATAGGYSPDDHGTSHISVVDKDRMAVSLTTTINTGFGSKLLSSNTGLLLNNQMDDFSTPGMPNVYGIQPSPANFIMPGKRPLSSMSPIIAQVDGDLRAVVGASGGPRIVSAVLQTLVRLLALGDDVFTAVASPRLHHQLFPSSVYAEHWNVSGIAFDYSEEEMNELTHRGHHVNSTDWGAIVQAILVDIPLPGNGPGLLHAASDPRKDGAPAGY